MHKAKLRRFFWQSIILVATLGMSQAATAQNNKPSDDNQAVRELLSEVRMLRQALQAIQRMSVDTYRSQLLVDRIRVNREDIRRLTESLNDTRELLSKTQATIPQFIERHKILEARAQSEVDQNKKAELELEARQVKDAVERYKSQIEPLKEREQQMAAELNAAKAKVEELEGRLDLLERALENDRRRLEDNKPVQKVP